MPLTAPLPNPIWINPRPLPVYGRPPPRREPLTDVAALALLDEATAYAALFPTRTGRIVSVARAR